MKIKPKNFVVKYWTRDKKKSIFMCPFYNEQKLMTVEVTWNTVVLNNKTHFAS